MAVNGVATTREWRCIVVCLRQALYTTQHVTGERPVEGKEQMQGAVTRGINSRPKEASNEMVIYNLARAAGYANNPPYYWTQTIVQATDASSSYSALDDAVWQTSFIQTSKFTSGRASQYCSLITTTPPQLTLDSPAAHTTRATSPTQPARSPGPSPAHPPPAETPPHTPPRRRGASGRPARAR